MDVVQVITELGGVAARADLLARSTRSQLEQALRDGTIVRLARNRYALRTVEDAVAAAHTVGGALCLTSAALHHGWAVKHVPDAPHISVPRGRKVPDERRTGVHLHHHALGPDDVSGVATSKAATLLQCLRSLPFDEALCIADSAARAGEVALLRQAARTATGAGAAKVRRVAALAREEAANPFESCLRAISLEVPGLAVEAQAVITSVEPWVRPDLVDRELRIVLEADSFAWHGDRGALRRDARRYDLLVVDGWLVLRFAWEDVMFDPDFVRGILVAAVQVAQRRTEVTCERCRAA